MQFKKKTSSGSLSDIGKFLTKIILVILILFAAIILIERIDFPSPNKKIENVIPNENFKIVK